VAAVENPDKPHSILVVDDEDAVRNVLVRMLQASGYVVASAPTAEAAIELFDAGRRFDLVVCDQRMPGMTGSECLDRIWQMVPDQRVVRVAGALQDEEDGEIPVDRISPVLTKPFTMERLLATVRAAIAGVTPP
jgi:CheY-like chemotaxis protein